MTQSMGTMWRDVMALMQTMAERPALPAAAAPSPSSTPTPASAPTDSHLTDDVVLQMLASAAMRAERETGTREAASLRQLTDATHTQLVDVLRALRELQRAAEVS
jgi:hypothetical protein